MSAWKNRPYGEESPYYALGPFKIRLPFLHYRFELPDYLQGLLMCAVDLAAIPLMVELLGMPFEAAIAIVMINGMLYLLHHILGDPVVPGWITPAIPLVMVYVQTFDQGVDRVHALIAFQMMLGLLSLILGRTQLASKVVGMIPAAIKSGVILGAGVAAIAIVFKEGGRFDQYPITISIAVGISFYLIFSRHFSELRQRGKLWSTLGKLGIFPIIILAIIIAPLAHESSWPSISWGFTQPNFLLMFREYTIFGVGIPPMTMFLTAIPTVLAAYIVLFGDILQSKAILAEADIVRADEKIDYDPNRAHLIFGGRNFLMSIFGPHSDVRTLVGGYACGSGGTLQAGKREYEFDFRRIRLFSMGYQYRFAAVAYRESSETHIRCCSGTDTINTGVCECANRYYGSAKSAGLRYCRRDCGNISD